MDVGIGEGSSSSARCFDFRIAHRLVRILLAMYRRLSRLNYAAASQISF